MTGILNALIAGVSGAVKDAYFNLVSLLLPGNGTNGAQNNTFLDSSANTFTITRNGNTTQGTFSPFSQTGWGNYFDGNGDYLQTPNNAAFNLSSGSFTIEAWVYRTNPTTSDYVFWSGTATGSNTGLNFYVGGDSKLYIDDGVTGTTGYGSVSGNQWVHVALIRDGSNGYLYVNGVCANPSNPVTQAIATGGIGLIGCAGVTTQGNFDGYISNLRVIKGQALVTGGANFTPPTGPVNATQVGWNGSTTALTGTCSIVTCQSNRFIDNSSNNFTITRNGNTSVVAFSPFAPTQSYSAAAVGGSGYFDGVNDSLQIADATALDLGLGNFTIETWIYVSGGSGTFRQFFSKYTGGVGIEWYVNSSNKLEVYFNGGAGQITSTGTINTNTWYHVVLVRSGTGAGQTKFYINGDEDGSSQANVNVDNAGALYIGESGGGSNDFLGYVSNLRIIKGTAVYTGAFTPPTKPLAASGADSAGSYPSTTNVDTSFASSACSLLLNFTNAGVVDATAKNVLETVGNAQISTTGAGGGKWGGGSISFDGTGDRATMPGSALLALGGGDFTVEGWVYKSANTAYMTLCGNLAVAGENVWQILADVTGNKICWYNGASSSFTITSSATLNTGAWYYIAFVRSGSASNNFKLYINGSLDTQATMTTNYDNTSRPFFLGHTPELSAGRDWNGYVDDFRITKGYARTITTPTAPFPVQ